MTKGVRVTRRPGRGQDRRHACRRRPALPTPATMALAKTMPCLPG